MNLSKSDMLRLVIDTLGKMSDVKDIKITSEINPVESLALDSGNGIEFALEMEDKLSITIPVEDNPFVKNTPIPCARTVGEIADFLLKLSAKQEATK